MSRQSRYDVYGIGNALVDLEYEVPDTTLVELSVDRGLMTLIDEARHHALLDALDGLEPRPCGGGSAANTMTAIAQLGGKAFYSCKVADDATGHFFLEDLTGNGVETNLAKGSLDSGHTGKCIVMVTPDAERSMSTFLGITQKLSMAELDEEAARWAAHVYIEGYLVPEPNARAAAIRVREIAEAAGVPTALTLSDVNMVRFFRDGLMDIIGDGLDLVFSNEEEARLMFGASDIEGCVEGLRGTAKRFAITRGARGAVLYDGDRVIEIAADRVDPVDSNGAGDIYAGAFLYGLTRDMPFEACGRLAGEAAKALILQFGARLSQDQMRDVAARVIG